MPFLSAYDDFKSRTLNAFSDALQKLRFVSLLRTGEGEYSHWGMKRTYGQDKANEAIARVHSELTLDVLGTPIPELHKAMREHEFSLDVSVEELGPPDWGGGTKEHLDYVMTALTLLRQTSSSTSRPVA